MVKTNIAVLGAGYWGRNIVRTLAELGLLYAVCDRSSEALERAKALTCSARLVNDYRKVLEDPAVDAVVVATPAETHAVLADHVLSAGKDVLVEKPLALNMEDAARLVERSRREKRILMVGHLLEYHPAFLELSRLVNKGILGSIRYIYSNRLNLGLVRREENILWSFAPHDIALILRLLGSMPFEVSAVGGSYLQPNIADTTVTNLLFDNGVRAHIYVSWLHPYKEQRLVVIGSEKMVVFNDVDPENKLLLFDERVIVREEVVEHVKAAGKPVHVDTYQPLKAELEHFAKCIQDRATPLTDGESALRVLCVLKAAQRSLITNGQPALLPVTSAANMALAAN